MEEYDDTQYRKSVRSSCEGRGAEVGRWSSGFISIGVMQRASHSEGTISAGSLGTAWDLFPLPLRPSVELAHQLPVMVTRRVMNTV